MKFERKINYYETDKMGKHCFTDTNVKPINLKK